MPKVNINKLINQSSEVREIVTKERIECCSSCCFFETEDCIHRNEVVDITNPDDVKCKNFYD